MSVACEVVSVDVGEAVRLRTGAAGVVVAWAFRGLRLWVWVAVGDGVAQVTAKELDGGDGEGY